MKHIFILEMKKAIRNRKNWFVMILYVVMLIFFVLSNVNAFQEIRENEIRQINHLAKVNTNTTNLIHESLARETGNWPYLRESTVFSEAFFTHADSTERFASNLYALMEAMNRNDRSAELFLYSQMLWDIYYDVSNSYEWRGMFVPLAHFPLQDGPFIDFEEWDEFNRLRAEFVQRFVDNDIHYLYRSEMKGFNFIYQAMLRFLPFTLLIIVFLTVCDVFTRENEQGSYKFLLLQPLSRKVVYLSKLMASFAIAFLQFTLPLILLFCVLGIANGWGSANYPVLIHTESYATLNPLQNFLFMHDRRGFVFYDTAYFGSVRTFTNHGYGYVLENASLGISSFNTTVTEPLAPDSLLYELSHLLDPWRSYHTAFLPNPRLYLTNMAIAILMTLPLYMALILVGVSVSAMIGIISQSSTISLTLGAVVGSATLLFTAPVKDASVLERLNPFFYTNPLNILNGLGSTTALTGMLVLLGFSFCFIVVGMVLFSRRDIRC